ncbi:MAG: hypothetical protein ACREJX_21330, partial [Polyangiaceae bacterium]
MAKLAPAATFPDRIAKAVHFAGALWLLGEGDLVSIDDATHARVEELLGQTVFDMHRSTSGELWALTFDLRTHDVRVWNRTAQDWKVRTEIGITDTPPIALTEVEGEPLVLTASAAVRVQGTHATVVRLDHVLVAEYQRPRLATNPELALELRMSAAVVGDLAFAGANGGEFGDSLARIELRTGHVEELQRVDGTLCGGDYNPGCDPITAVVVDPSHAGCVLAGVGFLHMGEEGKLLRICDRDLTVAWTARADTAVGAAWVFDALLDTSVVSDKNPAGYSADKWDNAWKWTQTARQGQAVFDLVPGNGGVWMVTPEALYFSSGGDFA